LQNSFVQAWVKLHGFRSESSFGSWLRRIAVNECLTLQRKQRFWLSFSNDKVDAHAAEWRDDSAGTLNDLEQAIHSLPLRSRQVLVLHDIEGYTHEEVSEQLKMAVGTSKAQLHRARKRLQELLKDARP
jgi:RNA polymerase sigma-70 factor (ECF subfamily)